MRDRKLYMYFFLAAIGTTILVVPGCKEDETTTPPSGLSVSSGTATTSPGGQTNVTITGGTAPYTMETGPDTVVATATLSGSTITVAGVASGYTSLVIKDAADATVRLGIAITGPITFNLFPLVAGHQFVYAGYAINTNGSTVADPNSVYRTSWSLADFGAYWVIVDSTTLQLSTVVTVTRNLLLVKLPNGDYNFAQTLGPFYRAIGVSSTDTVKWITVASPSVGIGGTWTAFDSIFASPAGSVRLQINGVIEGGETITDSSSARAKHNVVRFRTFRNVTVGSTTTTATTARLWLAKDVGPVQLHIAEDSENLGHFRVMRGRNF